MKKVVSVLLAIFIFAIPLCCFADTGSADFPTVLPYRDLDSVTNTGAKFEFTSGLTRYFGSDSPSPVYLCYFYDGSLYRLLAFTTDPNQKVYWNSYGGNSSTTTQTWSLSSEYEGYFYSQQVTDRPTAPYLLNEIYSSPQDAISHFNNSVFSTTLDLSQLVDGSVSWLSAVVDGVLQAPLLLFLILSSFIGIAIGLLFRFRRG